MRRELGEDSMSTKKIATFGVFVALAFIFSYIESLIPFHFAVPGMKLGLANIVVLVALYQLGAKEAFVLSLIRVVLVGFTFGNMYSLMYSLAGGLLSYIMMLFVKKTKLFSIVGVSVVGALSHNIGQIIVAMYVLETKALITYLPVLMVMGSVTGVIIGILGSEIVKRVRF